MKVILLKNVNNLGSQNQIVDVKDGYGNFLVQKKLAVVFSLINQTKLQQSLFILKQEQEQEINKLNLLKNQIEKLNLNFFLKANGNKIFQSITNKQIIKKILIDHKIELNKYMFVNNKNYGIGEHVVVIKLGTIFANLKIKVDKINCANV